MANNADHRSAIEKAVARMDQSRARQPKREVQTSESQNAVVEALPLATQRKPTPPTSPSARERVSGAAKVPPVKRRAAGSASLSMEGLITVDNPNPETIAEFRRIKRPLIAKAFAKGVEPIDRGNLIMVTSALPNEGKTNTAVNLARSIAMERNYTCLLYTSPSPRDS